MDCRWASINPGQCKELVYKRDCYRRTGRGPSGFEMHYTEAQCGRKAKYNGYCHQHKKCNHGICDRRAKEFCWEHKQTEQGERQ